MDTKNLVIVNEQIGNTGAVVWWTFKGEVQHSKLYQGLLDQQLSDLTPDKTSLDKCLQRAIQAAQAKRMLARPIGRSAGWAMVSEKVLDDESLQYEELYRIVLQDDQLQVSGNHTSLAASVKTKFSENIDLLTSADTGLWLVKIIERELLGVRLRDRGGLYFLPPNKISLWRKLSSAIQSASPDYKMYEVPAMRSEEAVRAVLDAVAQEAFAESEEMRAKLEEGNLSKRGIQGKASRCDSILEKVEFYEKLLGGSLDKLHENIDTLKADLAAAALLTNTDAQDAA